MDLTALISERIAMAFWSIDDIERHVLEAAAYGGPVDTADISAQVRRAWAERWADADRWPRPRNVERLAGVFEHLRGERVMTIDNAGYTSQDGMASIDEVIADVPYKLVGYVYYHEQDVGRCLASKALTLSFGAFRDTDVTASSGKTKAEMGAYVADLLRRAGCTVEWDGQPGTKLMLVDFTWDRLPTDPPWGARACAAALRARPLGAAQPPR